MEPGEIFFSKSFSIEDSTTFLIELPAELLDEMRQGNSLCIKGADTDFAVLCSSTKTYSLKSNETSNSLIILSNSYVSAMPHSVVLLEEIVPPLDRAYDLLQNSLYTLSDNPASLFTYADLLTKTQASPRELSEYLEKIEAFEYNNNVRMFDPETKWKITKKVLYLIREYKWEVVFPDRIMQKIPKYPPDIVKTLLSFIGSFSDALGYTQWHPNLPKLYEIAAIQLFLISPRYFAEEFSETFKNLLSLCFPEIYRRNIPEVAEIIKNISIPITYNSRPAYRYSFIHSLPYDLHKRLEFLFQLKEKFALGELQILLSDVIRTPIATVLVKYTRRIVDSSGVFFTHKLK